MPVAVAAIGTAYSIYAGQQAAKRQSQAMNAQQGAANQQLALEQQFAGQQQGLYGPLEQQMVQQASSSQPLDYGQISGQIQGGYDTAQRNLSEQLASRGLGSSGLAGAGATGLEIGRANSLSTAFQQGLDRRRQLGLGLLGRYNPRADVQGVAGAYGNLQGLYGQYSGMYGGAAQGAYGNAASALQGLAQYFTQQPGQQTPDVSGSINAAQPLPGASQYSPISLQGPEMPIDYSQLQAPMQPPPFNGQPYQPLASTTVPIGYGATTTGTVD